MSPPVRWGLAAAYAAGIFVLSSLPGTTSYRLPVGGIDKALHFIVYFFFAALLDRALVGSKLTRARSAILAAAVAAAYAVSDEIHQAFVPGRTASAWDWLADAAGALSLAAAVLWAAGRKATRPGRSGGP